MTHIKIQIKEDKTWQTIEGIYEGEVKILPDGVLFKPSNPQIVGGLIKITKIEKKEKKEKEKEEE